VQVSGASLGCVGAQLPSEGVGRTLGARGLKFLALDKVPVADRNRDKSPRSRRPCQVSPPPLSKQLLMQPVESGSIGTAFRSLRRRCGKRGACCWRASRLFLGASGQMLRQRVQFQRRHADPRTGCELLGFRRMQHWTAHCKRR